MTQTIDKELWVEQRGSVLWLTINREARRNAMSHDVLAGLQQAIDAAQTNRDILAIVIIEQRPFQWPGQERLEPPGVGLRVLALDDTVPKLKGHDGRDHDAGFLPDGTLKSAPHVLGGTVDQRNACVRVQKIRHRKRTRFGVGG